MDYKDIEQRKKGSVISIEEEMIHNIKGYRFFLNYVNLVMNRKETKFKHQKRTYIFDMSEYQDITTVGFGDLVYYCGEQDITKKVPNSVKLLFKDILAHKRLPIEFRDLLLSKFTRDDFENSISAYEFLSFTRNERPVGIKLDTQFMSSFIKNIYSDSEIDVYYTLMRNRGDSVTEASKKVFSIISKFPYISRIYNALYEENLAKEEKNQGMSDPNFAMGGITGPSR